MLAEPAVFQSADGGCRGARFTDEKKYFVSEASVYRLLKAYDLITSTAYVVIKAANEFKDKTEGSQAVVLLRKPRAQVVHVSLFGQVKKLLAYTVGM
ncbi:hypothetical protein ACVWWG_003770 [Bradyrhizobium sp. LB7.2]